MVRLVGRVGGAWPGRKVLTLVHAMIAGASHIDHADTRADTGEVLHARMRKGQANTQRGAGHGRRVRR